jgi:hypothetical protein
MMLRMPEEGKLAFVLKSKDFPVLPDDIFNQEILLDIE